MKKRKTFVAAVLATAGIGYPTAVMAKTGDFIQDFAYVVARSVCADEQPGVYFSAKDAALYLRARHGKLRRTSRQEDTYIATLAKKLRSNMDRNCNISAAGIRFAVNGRSDTIPTRYTPGSLSDTPFEF